MRFSARYLSTLLLTLTLPTLLPTLLFAQTTTPQTGKTSRSSISGRVTIKEKGVGGVLVALRKNEIQMPYEPVQKAITDPDGFYRITSVAPGNYEVFPTLPAFVPAERRDVRSKLVLVGEDDNVDGINFSMVRGGVITGRITDADGRPLIQQQVNIYQEGAFNPSRLQPQQPPQPIFPAASVQTDDRGSTARLDFRLVVTKSLRAAVTILSTPGRILVRVHHTNRFSTRTLPSRIKPK